MATRDLQSPRRLSFLLSLLATTALGILLWHLIYRGTPHSFDPLIYSRSIWGIARGDFYNPVLSAPVFGIHGQFVQLLLAPFTLLIPPAIVLVIAQAIAFGVTIGLAASAFGRIATEHGLEGQGAVAAGALLTIASPLVINAFFFDVRPEMLGIPLLVAAGIRVVRRGEMDRIAVALFLASLAAREDYAIFVAPAVLLIPAARRVPMRVRVLAAAAALGYFAFFVLVLRRLLGGAALVQEGFHVAGSLFDASFGLAQRAPLAELARYKLEILLVALSSIGGFALRSRRWFLLAVPGLLALLALNRGPQWTLNTHYSMFTVPGLVIAGVAGYQRWVEQGRPYRRTTIAIAIVLAAGAYVMSSAAPGGGRYLELRFGWSLRHPWQASPLVAPLVPIRELLEAVPSDAGLAAPYLFAAPLAQRRTIVAVEFLPKAMLQSGDVPRGVDWVAVMPQYWGYARLLVQRRGFVVRGHVPGSVVLLSRPDR